MKFICLKYLDKMKWSQASADEKNVFLEACLNYDGKLREAGHFFSSQALDSVGGSVALRYRNGQIDATAERASDEFLGGILFLDARDLNHAIVLVSQHPVVQMGSFEIHPVEFEERVSDRYLNWTEQSF